LIELYEATFKTKYINFAKELINNLITYFWDVTAGGFYFTPEDGEELLFRQKETYDGAIPSGNSVGFFNLIRLSRLLAEPELESMASKLGRAFSANINQLPSAHTLLMVALDFALGPTYEVLIEGDENVKHTKDMISNLRKHFLPSKVVHLNMKKNNTDDLFKLPSIIKSQGAEKDKATAYVCVNYSCQKPTNDIQEMLRQLGVENK